MASCSSYAAAFGYQVFIVPVAECGVDLNAISDTTSSLFVDQSQVASASLSVEDGGLTSILVGDPGVNVVYDGNAVTQQTTFRLYGLTSAALETDTGSETVATYDTESLGFDQAVAVSKSWSLTLEGLSLYTDSAYKVLRLLEQNAVAGGLKCKIARIGPTGTTEAVFGYATLTGFSESLEAGSIVSWSVTAEGFGPYALDLDNSNSFHFVCQSEDWGAVNGGNGDGAMNFGFLLEVSDTCDYGSLS